MVQWQSSLFAVGPVEVDPAAATERIALDDHSWIDVTRGYLHGADDLCAELVATVGWQQGRRRMYDREVDDPRLSHWYRAGDAVPDVLDEVGRALGVRYGRSLGRPGLNFYRDGRDSVAFHRDRELRRVDDALVAVLTLGARRSFLVRPRGGGRSLDLAPSSGDLLVMGGRCQLDWEHGVPKVARAGARISASWRWSGPPPAPPSTPRRRGSSRPGSGAGHEATASWDSTT